MSSTKIHRFRTYQHQPILEEIFRVRDFESADGKRYKLEIANDTSGTFELCLPSGDKITDTMNSFSDRKALYELLDEGIYDLLTETMLSITGEILKEQDSEEIVVTFNTERYIMTVNKSSGMCKLILPERVKEFHKDDLYLEVAELPILCDGKINEILRNKLKKLGISLPNTPYELGFKIDPTNQQ